MERRILATSVTRRTVALAIVLRVTMPAVARAQDAGTPASSPADCLPACRSAFVCVRGSCVSACNPACAASESCTPAGQCVPVAPPAPAPPPPPSPVATPSPPRPSPPPPAYDASAAGSGERRAGFEAFAIGAEVGGLFAGTVHVKSASLDTEAGPFASVWGELIAGGVFSFGFAGIAASSMVEDVSTATILDFAATLKGRISVARALQIRPGITLGYQRISSDLGAAEGFDPGLTVSLAYRTSDTMAFVLDGGFISQPVGGTGDATVTFAPIGYAAFGVEFGR